jgi:hypothetical protein
MEWARILAYITGTVDQELLLRNEYLAAENRILRGQLTGRLRFSDAERAQLGEIGRRLGREALGEVANAALPDTILARYRRPVARKFDGSRQRRKPGRPRISRAIEELIVRMAEENPSWERAPSTPSQPDSCIAAKRHPFDQLVRSAQDVRWQCKAESLEALAKPQPHTRRRSAGPDEVLLA